ncbi:shikimate dehydrogenase [Cysteiniphilum halobium]|uniref:shikimate dehydrogenase n=1 Tax=Cysteiniphilum halobium TaxID=2219059 RepID=UPI000E64F1FD|nr:shikimate dehydrogenase [Cysteiniphilum halobium]
MLAEQKIDRYYVIGNPVKHSLSPKIHTDFASQTGQIMRYEALEICPDNLEQTLNVLRLDPMVKGLSVTLPFKEALYHYCDKLDDLAQEAEAVSNVVINSNRAFIGLNLDGLGLVNDIKNNLNISLQNKRILILGAGGAAKGILGAIVRENPKSITITNRTKEKAYSLVARSTNSAIKLHACALDEIEGEFDIIINATSASVAKENLPLQLNNFASNALAYDLMYAPNGTVFTTWCQSNNIKAIDGKGMLLELSKIAFQHWRGVEVQ